MSRYVARVRSYQKVYARVGPVVLGVLRLVGVDEFEEEGDPYDTVAYVLETRSKTSDYVEVEVELISRSKAHESLPDRFVRGEYNPTLRGGGKPLYPRPSRLLRVGVVRVGRVLERMGESGGGYARLGQEDIEWHRPRGEVYVFEGEVEAPEDVAYVIIEADHGARWVRTLKTFVLRPPSQQYDQQES